MENLNLLHVASGFLTVIGVSLSPVVAGGENIDFSVVECDVVFDKGSLKLNAGMQFTGNVKSVRKSGTSI